MKHHTFGLIKKIKNIISSPDLAFIYLTALYLVTVVFVSERKVFFAVSFVFVCGLYYIFRNWKTTLLFGFMILRVLPVGQTYKFLMTGPQDNPALFYAGRYQEGRSAFLVLSPAYTIGCALIILSAYLMVKMYVMRRLIPIEFLLLLVVVCLKFVSSLFAQAVPVYSFFHVLEVVMVSAWGIVLFEAAWTGSKIMNRVMYSTGILSLFEFILVVFQWIRQKPIGLLIEQTRSGMAQEPSTDFFRVFGSFAHPNLFASELVSIVFLGLLFYFVLKRNFFLIGAIAALVCLILTQSRAALLGLGVGLVPLIGFLLWRYKHEISNVLRKKISVFWSILIVAVMILVTTVFSTRVINTFVYSTGEGGGFDVRRELTEEALELIKANPIIGVGYDAFIPVASRLNVTGVMGWFPETVHNAYLQIASESGILAAFMVVLLIGVLVRRVMMSVVSKEIKYSAFGFIVAQAIFMIYHPIDSVTTICTVIVIWLLHKKLLGYTKHE